MTRRFLLACFILFVLGVSYLFWGTGGWYRPSLNNDPVNINIPKGIGLIGVAEIFKNQGVIENTLPFILGSLISQKNSLLKAGEYEVLPHSMPEQILEMIVRGQTVRRMITIPEGWTVAQIVFYLNHHPDLIGEITSIPKEGWLLPETYAYQRGEQRQDVLNRMYQTMEEFLRVLWNDYQENEWIHNPGDLLILASIVEKETGVEAERPRIASIFLNRLKQDMKLQSDPTVIYALTKGEKLLERELLRTDLKYNSPYNTYVYKGLPPTAIACPGKKALQAVINPLTTEELYFVANGTGGHAFATTLKEHNKNVQNWIIIKKSQ